MREAGETLHIDRAFEAEVGSEILSHVKQDGYSRLLISDLDSPDEELTRLVESFSSPTSRFGQPLVMEVHPEPGSEPISSRGSAKFDLHTDLPYADPPPRYQALLCILPDQTGGGMTLLADGYEVFSRLPDNEQQWLANTPIPFETPGHIDAETEAHRIVERVGTAPVIRFRYDRIPQAFRTRAVERFRRAGAEAVTQFSLQPGEVVIIDNYRMLHGRTAINEGIHSARWFKRMYGDPR